MTTKRIAIVVALLVVVGVGYWWVSSEQDTAAEVGAPESTAAQPSPSATAESPAPAPPAAQPVSSPAPSSPPPQRAPQPSTAASTPTAGNPLERCLGSPNAPIMIEVFSDYQCPACRQYYLETVQFVLQEYATAGKVCVIYYEFPLDRIHKHAREAARYAQAAHRLSPAHWVRVNETLYTLQAQWSTDGQIEPLVARALPPADMEKVRQSVNDPKIAALIDRDLAEGRRRGITGTPTTFLTVNGQTHRINGPVQYAIMKQFLDKQLGQWPWFSGFSVGSSAWRWPESSSTPARSRCTRPSSATSS